MNAWILIFTILAATAVSGFAITAVVWLVYRGVARLASTWTLRRPPRAVSDPGSVSIWAIGVPIAIPIVLVVILGTSLRFTPWVVVVATAVGVMSYLSAWLLHGLPGHSRNLKYALFFVGSSLAPLATVVGGGIREEALITAIAAQFISSVLIVVIAIGCVLLFRPDRLLVPGDPSGPRAAQAWNLLSWVQGPDPLSILAMVALSMTCVGGMTYLVVRWCAKARMSRHAIVYLRSFHYEDAGNVFGLVITPAVHRTVPVTGLVHVKQPDSTMLKSVPLLWRASFATIADAAWQKWVEANLSRALAVIVDVSVTTDSVAWEIDRVKRMLPSQRIVLMHRRDVVPPAGTGLATIAYDIANAADLTAARKQVSDWLVGAMTSFDPALGKIAPRISPPRWQLPVFAIIAAFSLVPAAGVAAVSAVVVTHVLRGAESDVARVSLQNIATGVELYRMRNATCPSVEELERSGMIAGHANDPWGNAVRIECDPEILVTSSGRDGRFGTDDDERSR